MTKTTKMTKRDYFNILRDAYPADAENFDEVMAFIDHELELLARKNNAIKKPTAVQVANEAIKANILEAMADDAKYTISEMLKQFNCLEGMSNQKVNAILRLMIANGDIVRTEDKRKAYFSKS